MLLERRHAPVSRRRRTTTATAAQKRDGSTTVRTGRGRKVSILDQDHADRRRGGRFRWFLSTCLAAGIGAFAIIFVVLGARDPADLSAFVTPQAASAPTIALPEHSRGGGLTWSLPKADRLVATNDALSTRFIIQESIRQRRDNREYLLKKTFAKVVGRLGTAPPATDADRIPPFNPYTLYAEPNATSADAATAKIEKQDANARIVELLGGILPTDDGQEMDHRDATEAVLRDSAADEVPAIRPAFQADGAETATPQELLAQRLRRTTPALTPPATTDIPKSHDDSEEIVEDDLDNREVKVVKVGRGDTLTRIIDRLVGDVWQKRAIVEAARPHVADNALVPGQEVHVTVVPSVTRQGRFEPIRVSIFGDGHEHKVTLSLNSGGDFVASQSPIDERMTRAAMTDDRSAQTTSLYNAIYVTALSQGIGHDIVAHILRVHANDADYRRRARHGDQFELFFDVRDDDKRGPNALGDLLMTSLTVGGESRRFYRFRTTDGAVDYYDENGNTARQFLMRRPVRAEGARLTSGFGMRRHPLLGQFRLHAGVDFSAPIGTPIMAAGAGIVEEAGRKGEYGNHIRIRHANGYKTTYSHLSRFGSGISPGVRVTQGQVIGYIGNTGLSTGPHLHYEVTINNQHVDPMSIQVPKERRLAGRQLADFHKERVRIDDLMRRNPVSTVNVDSPVRQN